MVELPRIVVLAGNRISPSGLNSGSESSVCAAASPGNRAGAKAASAATAAQTAKRADGRRPLMPASAAPPHEPSRRHGQRLRSSYMTMGVRPAWSI